MIFEADVTSQLHEPAGCRAARYHQQLAHYCHWQSGGLASGLTSLLKTLRDQTIYFVMLLYPSVSLYTYKPSPAHCYHLYSLEGYSESEDGKQQLLAAASALSMICDWIHG